MALKTNKVRCTVCKTKNDATQARCSVCTKPITQNALASQKVHDELLWAQPVATRRTRRQNPMAKWFASLLLLAALGAANYFYLGYGPDWAHDVPQHAKGYEWRTYNGETYRADLPGTPVEESIQAGGTELSTASVWVNSRWNLLRDAETKTAGAETFAQQNLFATVLTAEGGKTDSLDESATVIVRNLFEGVTIEDEIVKDVDSPKFGMAVDLTATFRGHPIDNSQGVVKARIWTVGNKTYVAATFFDDTVDEDLHTKLVRAMLPSAP